MKLKRSYLNKSLVFCLVLLCTFFVEAQEFNARVTINAQQVKTVDKKMFKTLENQLKEFINERKWTDDVYTWQERIEWTLVINITEELSLDEFQAQAIITSSRPVYNSSYKSALIQHKDSEWEFRYSDNLALEFSETTHLSNLTALVAYYSYIVLGLDYDTYSKEGGSKYFQKAQDIVNNAQQEQEPGWKSYQSNKNRYWLVENLLNPRFKQYRNGNYEFHRLGLDLMHEDAAKGRKGIYKAMEKYKEAYEDNPTSHMLSVMFKTKSDEFVNIFDGTPSTERTKAFAILSQIDPANTSKYRKLTRN